MYTVVYNGVQIFKKKLLFEIKCTQFPWFNIGLCTVHHVHFVCTLYGRKMLSALQRFQILITLMLYLKFSVPLKYRSLVLKAQSTFITYKNLSYDNSRHDNSISQVHFYTIELIT